MTIFQAHIVGIQGGVELMKILILWPSHAYLALSSAGGENPYT